MVVFDFIITLVESFILSSFILVMFDLIQKVKPLVLLTLFFTAETTFFNSVYINNLLLLFIETITALMFLYYYCKHIQFFHIFIIFLGISFIMLSNTLSLFLFSIFFNLDVSNITVNPITYISVVSISKILYFAVCVTSLNFFKKNINILGLKKWWLFLIFLSIILIMMIVLLESIIFNMYNISLLIFLVVSSLILLVLAIAIYIMINSDTKHQISLAKQLIRNEYINKNYIQMNYLYNSTLKERHRMMYLLIKYKDLAQTGKNNELVKSLDEELKRIDKEVSIQSTDNPYFDFRLREFLKTLKMNGYKIKIIFQFEKAKILDQEETVSEIIDYINFLTNYSNEEKYLSLYITQLKEYLLIKIKVSSNEKIDLNKTFTNSRFKYELKTDENYKELSLLIRLE